MCCRGNLCHFGGKGPSGWTRRDDRRKRQLSHWPPCLHGPRALSGPLWQHAQKRDGRIERCSCCCATVPRVRCRASKRPQISRFGRRVGRRRWAPTAIRAGGFHSKRISSRGGLVQTDSLRSAPRWGVRARPTQHSAKNPMRFPGRNAHQERADSPSLARNPQGWPASRKFARNPLRLVWSRLHGQKARRCRKSS